MAGYRREKHTVESRAGEKNVIIAAEQESKRKLIFHVVF